MIEVEAQMNTKLIEFQETLKTNVKLEVGSEVGCCVAGTTDKRTKEAITKHLDFKMDSETSSAGTADTNVNDETTIEQRTLSLAQKILRRRTSSL